MAAQKQSNSRGSGSGPEGTQAVAAAVGGAQPESQYFQSFDASHITPPPSRPPIYTAQQKGVAIDLLNKGAPAKKIAEHIGGTCSKNNPYRWREEELERERRAEADRRAVQLRQDRVQAARNRQLQIDIALIVMFFVVVFVWYFIEVLPLVLTLDRDRDLMAFIIWILWNTILIIWNAMGIITPGRHAQLHFFTLAIFYVYLFYYYPIYYILFPSYRPRHKPIAAPMPKAEPEL